MKRHLAYLFLCCTYLSLSADLKLHECADTMQLPLQEVQHMYTHILEHQRIQENGKGWSKYYHLLPQKIRERGDCIGCEVGVAYGGHSLAILSQSHVARLYAIDPYLEYGDVTNGFLFRTISDKALRQRYWDLLYLHVADRLSPFGERACLLRMKSLDAVPQFSDASLDFIFLDANHSFDAVMQDLSAWFAKLKSGGLFCGDDYASSRHPGVTQAVNKFFKAKGIKVHSAKPFDRFLWVEKP